MFIWADWLLNWQLELSTLLPRFTTWVCPWLTVTQVSLAICDQGGRVIASELHEGLHLVDVYIWQLCASIIGTVPKIDDSRFLKTLLCSDKTSWMRNTKILDLSLCILCRSNFNWRWTERKAPFDILAQNTDICNFRKQANGNQYFRYCLPTSEWHSNMDVRFPLRRMRPYN